MTNRDVWAEKMTFCHTCWGQGEGPLPELSALRGSQWSAPKNPSKHKSNSKFLKSQKVAKIKDAQRDVTGDPRVGTRA